jgi:hypothetical protein
MNWHGWILSGTALTLTGCTPPASEGGFDSPNPASRLYAIERAVHDNDQAAVEDLVILLDSVDPATRLMAIEALSRLTGETHGYRYDDDRFDRDAAIVRWQRAVAEGPLASTRTELAP